MYNYQKERPFIFTEEGVNMLLRLKDKIRNAKHTVFTKGELIMGLCGDSFCMLACVDFLVEKGDLIEKCTSGATQDWIYVKSGTSWSR